MTFGICSFLNFATQTLWFIWLFVSADGLTVLKVHNENSGGGTCTSDLDCQLNGRCTFGVCICSPAWTGTDCSALNLLPAAIKNGYQNAGSDVSSWGGGVHYDNVTNLFYMFVDEMDKHCGLSVWHQNSRCVVGVSDSPHGPFERVKVNKNICSKSPVVQPRVPSTWVSCEIRKHRRRISSNSTLLCLLFENCFNLVHLFVFPPIDGVGVIAGGNGQLVPWIVCRPRPSHWVVVVQSYGRRFCLQHMCFVQQRHHALATNERKL